MNVTIYQINMDRDTDRVCFLSYGSLERFQGTQKINEAIYDEVFSGEVNAKTLEDVYRIFNREHPVDYRGRSLSVSDIVKTDEGLFYCDSFGFKKVDARL